jgi:putative mRNA 3-end processing factor
VPLPSFQFYRGGIHFPDLALWLDPHERRAGPERVFVSHAHSDHTGSHREVILTEATARLMGARLGRRRSVEHVVPFHERRRFDGPGTPFEITLLPAGHILGSAMALVEWSAGSVLYTGDFKLRPSLAAERCEAAAARGVDVLIMETTFGLPEYVFPAADGVMRDIVSFCRETTGQGGTAGLLVYSLGKCQEVLCGLAGTGLPLVLHEAAWKMTRHYEDLGWPFPVYRRHEGGLAPGKVLLCPPNAAVVEELRAAPDGRLAVVTGWAIDSSCRYRARCDAAFPLSDHADFPGLIEFVRMVRPKTVFTLHGFAAEFAQTLRELGFDARALGVQEQLHLPLAMDRHL